MAATNAGNIAVLIDGDNVSPRVIVGLMAEIANYGTASVRRIYGDWTRPNMNGWKACLLDHSITPMQQFAYTTGKNATDGAMIIDAMDLLYTGRFSSFCIVSSDSDFTRLAARIREQGVTVYGFGERKTNNAFIAACDKFVYFDVLPMPAAEVELPLIQQPAPHPSPSRPPPPAMTTIERTGPRPIDKAALDAIRKAIIASMDEGDNCADLANVGHYLRRISPDLNARNYGYGRLKDFVEASGIVDVRLKTFENRTPVALVRLKDQKPVKRSFDQME
ncbi:NYN domain-containing protein [Boeremia exigua]|uniref:NYN domain-containing protein n=1 Tax=Boeremia exigua TaxID=749465 RepID=UPI001E8EB3CC|nr:NYN domain-containing protein [Boeremia exigua]KAH6629010.1 NYN domain-containing protein [Boeremia exigua]